MKIRFTTSVKVAAGYALLVILFLSAAGGVFRQIRVWSEASGEEREFRERRGQVHQLVTRLYRLEVKGQHVGLGTMEDYAAYQAEKAGVLCYIDTLRSLYPDTVLHVKLDTLQALLDERDGNLKTLLRLLEGGGTDALYRKRMEEWMARQDSIAGQTRVRKTVVTRQETYQARPPRKSFVKRLAEAFVPSRRDSVRTENTVREELVDSLEEVFNPVDTMKTVLADMQGYLQRQDALRRNRVDRQLVALRQADVALSARVGMWLDDLEREEIALSERRSRQSRALRVRAVYTMAGVAVAALLLAAVFFTMVWRDIARSNRYRRALEDARRRAEDLLEAREKLMLAVTHDIKAPAASILGYAELAESLQASERVRLYLRNMHDSAAHLLALVTSLLDFYRLDVNKMDVQCVAYNPYELLGSLCDVFLPLAEKKGLRLRRDLDQALDAVCTGDPFRLRQMVDNLLSNAVKFTAEGFVELAARRQGGTMLVEVRDSGCGMTQEEQQAAFREFTRLPGAQGQEGVGLGLSIVSKLAALLGGRVEVESRPGEGSVFRLVLPWQPAEGATVPPAGNRTVPPLRILAIDDDRIQLQLMESMLKGGRGTTVRCCGQPDELFRCVEAEPWDVILTDIQMPAMNGFELLSRLRKLASRQGGLPPVVAVTARSDMDEAGLRSAGFAACLHKPFTRNDLWKILEDLVSRSSGWEREPDAPPSPGQADSSPDFSGLVAFAAGDPEAARELLLTFAAETRRNAEAFGLAVGRQDTEQMGRLAHKMLPSLQLVGAVGLLPLLERTEREAVAVWADTGARASLEDVPRRLELLADEAERRADAGVS